MRDPITDWPRIKRGLRAQPVLLLINYEGALVSSPPSSSHLDQNIREVLISLRSRPNLTIGLISAMPLTSLQSMIRIKGIYYSGDHGLKIRGPDMEFIHPACTQDGLADLKISLQQNVRQGKLQAVEDKDSLAILSIVNWDKGRVVRMFENLLASRKLRPLIIYLGSDYTDEEAFQVVRGKKGIGIVVGRKNKTSAEYYLNGYDEVADFLLLLESFY